VVVPTENVVSRRSVPVAIVPLNRPDTADVQTVGIEPLTFPLPDAFIVNVPSLATVALPKFQLPNSEARSGGWQDSLTELTAKFVSDRPSASTVNVSFSFCDVDPK
jgi:hypothetical protein